MLLSRHELCRIYALFWSDFDADFYADIEDFVQISARKNARWNLCLVAWGLAQPQPFPLSLPDQAIPPEVCSQEPTSIMPDPS